jgi:very-short-patch-repair endonuclease
MRAPKKTVSNAQRLRRALSVPEARLWSRLRARAPGKPIFRRQHPIGPFVLDFFCSKARLAIRSMVRLTTWVSGHSVIYAATLGLKHTV